VQAVSQRAADQEPSAASGVMVAVADSDMGRPDSSRPEALPEGSPLSTSERVLWGLAFLLLLVALLPLLVEFGRNLWRAEHYRAVPLVWAGAAYLAYGRLQEFWGSGIAASRRPARWWPSLLLWGAVLACGSFAVLFHSPMPAGAAVLFALLAAAYQFGGWPLTRTLLPVWAVGWGAMPLPLGLDQSLIATLQRTVTSWASTTLDVFSVRHLTTGSVIELPGQQFLVEEACSGIHSLFAAIACVAFYVVAARRGPIRSALLLAAAVVWVLVANTCRVLAVVILAGWWQLPVTDGLGHELLGMGVFVMTMLLIVSTDRLLAYLVPFSVAGFGGEAASAPSPVKPVQSPPPRTAPWRLALPMLIAGIFAGLATMGDLRALARPASDWKQARLKDVPEDFLPARWGEWQRTGFTEKTRPSGDPFGGFSRIWHYQNGRLGASLSMDGPYPEWHNLAHCYEGIGWMVNSARNVSMEAGAGQRTELQLSKPTGEYATVFFAAYTDRDQPVSGLEVLGSPALRVLASLRERTVDEQRDARWVYQIQLLSTGGTDFTESERRELASLFDEMRRRIVAFKPAAIERSVPAGAGNSGDVADQNGHVEVEGAMP
jgi:exosortase